MRRLAVILLACAAAALPGCGEDEEQAAAPAAPADAGSTRLSVEVTRAGPQPVTVTLACGGAEPCDAGRVRRLDRVLRREDEDPARACTLQYGGPEQARVTGTLEGRSVDVTVTRANGCGIADYDALFAALGRTPPLAG